ncbi:MAG: ABC transporter substrate-binding protein [Nitrospirae bacterium]|nr:ABC transporter substrate-binding protein [Nitrospirota bacterium]
MMSKTATTAQGDSRYPALIAAAVVALAIICSCSTKSGTLDGYVCIRLRANPTTLDPAFIVDVQGGAIAAKIYNGLIRLDADMNVVPDIAESWQISPDLRTYTFKLRRDIKFHNGKPLTATDAAYSLTRVLSAETNSPNAWVLRNVDGAEDFLKGKSGTLTGVTVADNYTIEITLRQPFEPFLKLLSMPAAYIVPAPAPGETGGLSLIVGTGPFIVDKWEPDREIVLRKNDEYFDSPARVKGIYYKIIPEDLTAVTEFMLGNVDVFEVTASAFSMFTKDKKYRAMLREGPGLNVYYLGFNTSRPPFDNPLLRRAIAHAIDRRKILETYFQNRGSLAVSPVPNALKKYTLADSYPFDREKAKALIKESHYSPSTKLRFYVTAAQESVDIAEIIVSYLKDAGIEAEIRTLEWSAYKSAINNGDTDMFWLGWIADYPDAENFMYPLYHSSNFGAGGNRTRYTNAEVDKLIETGRKTANDTEREQLYKTAEEQILRDAPAVYFWQNRGFTAVAPRIKNFRVYPIYNIDKGNLMEIQAP